MIPLLCSGELFITKGPKRYKKQSFSGSWSGQNDTIVADPKTDIMTIRPNQFWCRDQYIPRLARALNEAIQAGFEMTARHPNLAFSISGFKTHQYNQYFQPILDMSRQFIFFNQNENISPFMSPMTLRWIIHRYRSGWNSASRRQRLDEFGNAEPSQADIRRLMDFRDQFSRAMVTATNNGVEFNADIATNWALPRKTTISYGYMGINNLYYYITHTPLTRPIKYENAFPAFRELKEIRAPNVDT